MNSRGRVCLRRIRNRFQTEYGTLCTKGRRNVSHLAGFDRYLFVLAFLFDCWVLINLLIDFFVFKGQDCGFARPLLQIINYIER